MPPSFQHTRSAVRADPSSCGAGDAVFFGAAGDAVVLGPADDALLGEASAVLDEAEDVREAAVDGVDGAVLDVVAGADDEAATVLDGATDDAEVLSVLPPHAVRARANEAAMMPPARCRVVIWGP